MEDFDTISFPSYNIWIDISAPEAVIETTIEPEVFNTLIKPSYFEALGQSSSSQVEFNLSGEQDEYKMNLGKLILDDLLALEEYALTV